MIGKQLNEVIRFNTVFCRFFLRFPGGKPQTAAYQAKAIDRLLVDLSRYGGVLYAQGNEKFMKPTKLPLKVDLAICSPEKVKLVRLISQMRGYVYDESVEPDYSKLVEPVSLEPKRELGETLDSLRKLRESKRHGPVGSTVSIMVPQSPFVFLKKPLKYFRTIGGDTCDITRNKLMHWTWAAGQERYPLENEEYAKIHPFCTHFTRIPSQKPSIQIIPSVITNLSEMPNSLNDWVRRTDVELSNSEKDKLSTMFHGFEGL